MIGTMETQKTIDAKIVLRFLSPDWRADCVKWACGKCGYDKHQTLDNFMFNVRYKECDVCRMRNRIKI
jgi:hypothetical protein